MKDWIKKAYQLILLPFISRKNGYRTGITALVVCKDEEYNIRACLESLATFADEIICVDNGSSDDTLAIMQQFGQAMTEVKTKVLNGANLLLKEARNLGLKEVSHEWLLNSGGDFVFYTANDHPFQEFIKKVKKGRWYAAYRFKHVNLYGDLHHTYKTMKTVQFGEHYLIRMHKKLKFVESGKFDYLQLPAYYLSKKVNYPCFFHLDGLKSDDRLLYRNAYFEWRQLLNSAGEKQKSQLDDFPFFFQLWKEELFETTADLKVKFRFRKQLAKLHFMKYDVKAFYPYPEKVKVLMGENQERFTVVYENGTAVSRIDKKDASMKSFTPELDDLQWDVRKYEAKYASKYYLRSIQTKMTSDVGLKE